jgi:hypothetical protein
MAKESAKYQHTNVSGSTWIDSRSEVEESSSHISPKLESSPSQHVINRYRKLYPFDRPHHV